MALSGSEASPPNILFIAVDDLNDWIGPLGGHPQAQTPNLDRLAGRSMLFTRAYAASPLCIPSRRALLSGQAEYNANRKRLANAVTLPEAFSASGWWAAGAGKIFHGQMYRGKWDEFRAISKEVKKQGRGTVVPGAGNLNWGPSRRPRERMPDYEAASWVADRLAQRHEKPFFLALGIYRPHLPWIVPQEYFDRFPIDSISLPLVTEDDLDDVPAAGRLLEGKPDRLDDHDQVVASEAWKHATQAYLASVNFADDMVGVALDALDKSDYAGNTVVVLWGDHGFHLGEKEHWRKRTLWEEATRVPLMIRVPPGTAALPGGTREGAVSGRPVSLLDIYPTLLELSGLEPTGQLDGTSIVPLLRGPELSWRPAIMSHGAGNYAVRSEEFRYIVYRNGSEELYDHRGDPSEWNNVANDPDYAAAKKRLRKWLPVALKNPRWLPASGSGGGEKYIDPTDAINASNHGPCNGWRAVRERVPVHEGFGSSGYAYTGTCNNGNRKLLVYLHSKPVALGADGWEVAMVAELDSPADAWERHIEEAVQLALASRDAVAAMERAKKAAPPLIEHFADSQIWLTYAPTAAEIGPVPSSTDADGEFAVIRELAGVTGVRAADCGVHTRAGVEPAEALQGLGALPVSASLYACSDDKALYGIGYRKGTDRHNFSVVQKVSPYSKARCNGKDCDFYVQKLADDHACRQIEIAEGGLAIEGVAACDPFGPTAP